MEKPENYFDMIQICKSSDYTAIRSRSYSEQIIDLEHSFLGLNTEIVELLGAEDDINALEEIGDNLFYLTLGLAAIGKQEIVIEYPPQDTPVQNLGHGLIILQGDLQDHLKRIFYYGVELDVDFVEEKLSQIAGLLSVYALHFDSNLVECSQINFNKLAKKRYPNGFSEEAAVNRNTDDERIELEESVSGLRANTIIIDDLTD